MGQDSIEHSEIVDALGDTLGTDKAESLVQEAMGKVGVSSGEIDTNDAEAILDTIPDIDDDSLVSVAANTTKTQLLR